MAVKKVAHWLQLEHY